MQPETFHPARALGLIAILALAVGCLMVLRPFLSSLLWAAILVYSTWPAYRVLRERTRLSPGWAAGLMVLAEFLLIGLPLVFATPTRREEVEGLRASVEALLTQGMPGLGGWLGRVPLVGTYLQDWFEGFDLGYAGEALPLPESEHAIEPRSDRALRLEARQHLLDAMEREEQAMRRVDCEPEPELLQPRDVEMRGLAARGYVVELRAGHFARHAHDVGLGQEAVHEDHLGAGVDVRAGPRDRLVQARRA